LLSLKFYYTIKFVFIIDKGNGKLSTPYIKARISIWKFGIYKLLKRLNSGRTVVS
jgi:hypothetical protein